VIAGAGGGDIVFGGGGADLICAGAGNDRVYGEGGADRIEGGPGADFLNGDLGFGQQITGGPGRDFCVNATTFTGCEAKKRPLPPQAPPEPPCTPGQCSPTRLHRAIASESLRSSPAPLTTSRAARAAAIGPYRPGILECGTSRAGIVPQLVLTQYPPEVAEYNWTAGTDRDYVWWNHEVWSYNFLTLEWSQITGDNWAWVLANDQQYTGAWTRWGNEEALQSWITEVFIESSSHYTVNYLYWHQGGGRWNYVVWWGVYSNGDVRDC
jgi:hypothetical protein